MALTQGRGAAPCYLRSIGVTPLPDPIPMTPVDDFLAIYRRYLLEERGSP